MINSRNLPRKYDKCKILVTVNVVTVLEESELEWHLSIITYSIWPLHSFESPDFYSFEFHFSKCNSFYNQVMEISNCHRYLGYLIKLELFVYHFTLCLCIHPHMQRLSCLVKQNGCFPIFITGHVKMALFVKFSYKYQT